MLNKKEIKELLVMDNKELVNIIIKQQQQLNRKEEEIKVRGRIIDSLFTKYRKVRIKHFKATNHINGLKKYISSTENTIIEYKELKENEIKDLNNRVEVLTEIKEDLKEDNNSNLCLTNIKLNRSIRHFISSIKTLRSNKDSYNVLEITTTKTNKFLNNLIDIMNYNNSNLDYSAKEYDYRDNKDKARINSTIRNIKEYKNSVATILDNIHICPITETEIDEDWEMLMLDINLLEECELDIKEIAID